MSLKKKLLAATAVATLLLTQAVPAFAAENNNITRSGNLSIEKVLTLDGNTNFAPEEIFEFSIKPSDVQIGEKIDNLIVKKGLDLNNTGNISSTFANTDKPMDGEKTVKKTAEYNFGDKANVTYPSSDPAIYRYEVSENAGSNGPAVTYDSTKYILDVYVNEKAEVVALVAYELGDNGEPKAEKVPLRFDNRYDTETLAIDKKVEGVSGEVDKDFQFTLTVEESNTLKTGTSITATKTDKDQQASTDAVVVGTAKQFNLKNGEKFVLADLPVGTKYTITETDVEGYTKSLSHTVSEEQKDVEGGFVIKDGANTVTFTNTNNTITPTGLIITVAPYAAGLALVAGLGVLLVAKKRKITE
ncbi:hypothetical protein IGI96_003637 [Enterococcus sp. DIV0421]|uniref:DUF7601 domain-containing protein n=1 Tax=Enterococcus sp. DIV0421 TaxID=2774688 RepID=UPI003F207783